MFQPGTTDVTTRELPLDGEPDELGGTWPEVGAGPGTALGTPETGTLQLVTTRTAPTQTTLSAFRRGGGEGARGGVRRFTRVPCRIARLR